MSLTKYEPKISYIKVGLMLLVFLIFPMGSMGLDKGPLMETIYVPSEKSEPVSTNVLEAGKYYVIQASGVFSYWNDRTEGADAYYDYDDPFTDEVLDYRPLQVDNQSMYNIARRNGDSVEYNPNHIYETLIAGTGTPIKLYIWDIHSGSYVDNHGSLVVKIYAASQASGKPTKWDNNGHYYDIIQKKFNWNDAKSYAENLQFADPSTGIIYSGHLATITSQEENSWIVSNLISHLNAPNSGIWIGGYQEEGYEDRPLEGWHWITGETWLWTNWNPGEPNDANGGEKHLEIWGADMICADDYTSCPLKGMWNDEMFGGWAGVTEYLLIEYEAETFSIEGIAEQLRCYYGIDNCDYLDTEKYVLFIVGDPAVSQIKLALFDKEKKGFIENWGLASDLYVDYYLNKNKEGLAQDLEKLIESQEMDIVILKRFSQDAYVQAGTTVAQVTAAGKLFVDCIYADKVGCAVEGLALIGEAKLNDKQAELEYLRILEEVSNRDAESKALLDQIEESVESAESKLELADVIIRSKDLYDIVNDMEKVEDLRTLSRIDTIKVLQDTFNKQASKQLDFTLASSASSLLDLMISPGNYWMTSRFGALAGMHALIAEAYIDRARMDIEEFKQNPSEENYKRAVRSLMASYDNLAIGYFLVSASIQSCRDAPTGWLAVFIHDEILKNGLKVDEQINYYESLASINMERRYSLQISGYGKPLSLFGDISDVANADELKTLSEGCDI